MVHRLFTRAHACIYGYIWALVGSCNCTVEYVYASASAAAGTRNNAYGKTCTDRHRNSCISMHLGLAASEHTYRYDPWPWPCTCMPGQLRIQHTCSTSGQGGGQPPYVSVPQVPQHPRRCIVCVNVRRSRMNSPSAACGCVMTRSMRHQAALLLARSFLRQTAPPRRCQDITHVSAQLESVISDGSYRAAVASTTGS